MKLFAVLLLLLLGMFSLSETEVVHSFKQDCPQFFIKIKNKKVPPTVLEGKQYKQICQFYEGEYRFATLYDTIHRIPVYSAYTYTITENRGIDYNDWMIEPQLDEPWTNNNREMRRERVIPGQVQGWADGNVEEEQIWKQALKKDYSGTFLNERYTKGHVFPKSYAQGDQQKESTFTLTNVAPQTEDSNRQWADKVEKPMLKEIKENCKDTAYIVTGVIPGETWLPIERRGETIVQGVNIPRHFWTAYSCKSNNNINVSNAYFSQQITQPPYGKTEFKVKNMTIDTLNKKLETYYYKTPFLFLVFG
uniref:Endonuclease domain-containing 1 protein-like n=1 Tax=Astyanax mexicanus TaxID=7994 RepID=A0A3B1J1E9_ASTMX